MDLRHSSFGVHARADDYRHGDLPPVAATAAAVNSRVLDEIFIGWLAESYAAAGCLHHG